MGRRCSGVQKALWSGWDISEVLEGQGRKVERRERTARWAGSAVAVRKGKVGGSQGWLETAKLWSLDMNLFWKGRDGGCPWRFWTGQLRSSVQRFGSFTDQASGMAALPDACCTVWRLGEGAHYLKVTSSCTFCRASRMCLGTGLAAVTQALVWRSADVFSTCP
jgi:hypothetical protein